MQPTREEELLAHIARYRLATIASVNAVLYDHQHTEAAKKTLLRARETGLLHCFALGRRVFYQLTAKACDQIGVARSLAARVQGYTLLEQYSVLCFCLLHPQPRHRLRVDEFRDAFPHLARVPQLDPVHQTYCAWTEGEIQRLARLTVDAGTSVRALRDKCHKVVQEVTATPLSAAMKGGQFSVIVLVGCEAKSRSLQTFLDQEPFGPYVQVATVPQMRHLL